MSSVVTPSTGNGPLMATCDCCEQRVPAVFCGACQNSNFCSTCDAQIHKLKNKGEHQRSSIGGENGSAEAKIFCCPVHAGRPQNLYCEDCTALVCVLCRDFDKHRGHSVRSAQGGAGAVRVALGEAVESVAESVAAATRLGSQVDSMAKQVASDGKTSARREVENHFGALEEAVRTRQSQLRADVDAAVEHRRHALQEQQSRLRALLDHGTESCKEGARLANGPAGDLTHGYKRCNGALQALLAAGPVPATPVCDAAVPFSGDLAEALSCATAHGVIGGANSIQLDLDAADGSATLRWNTPGGGWVPAMYRVKLALLEGPDGEVGCRSRSAGYERVVADGYSASSSAPETPCAVNVNVRDLCGCRVLFSVQGYDGARCTAWAPAGGPVTMPPAFVRHHLQFSGKAFDENSLFYWIGTAEGTRPFENPAVSGEVSVELSSLGQGSSPASACLSHVAPDGESVFTENEANASMLIDIGEIRLLRPTGYCLRHDTQGSRGVLRNWVLQGSVEDTEEDSWVTLSSHVDDSSLAAQEGATSSFQISDQGLEGYRYFRLVQSGPNSSGKGRLMCCGIDFYGDVYSSW